MSEKPCEWWHPIYLECTHPVTCSVHGKVCPVCERTLRDHHRCCLEEQVVSPGNKLATVPFWNRRDTADIVVGLVAVSAFAMAIAWWFGP